MDKLSNYLISINSTIDNNKALFDEQKFESSENQDLFDKVADVFGKVKLGFQQLQEISSASKISEDEIRAITNELKSRKKELEEEFAEIKREIKIPQINPDDFAKLSADLKAVQIKLKQIGESQKEKNKLEKDLAAAILGIKTLWHDEYVKLKEEIDIFNKNSGSLTIEIEFLGRRDLFEKSLKEHFKGTGLNSVNYEKIIQKYPDFVEIYKDPAEVEKILKNTALSNFSTKFIEKMAEILTFRVEDKFTIKYHDKPLSDHSLGQRASALILFLLAQKDSSLIIIDQPEDDLDNQTIYEDVIKVLRKLKGEMQFIFVTHNANIPVLGDSEQVISCFCDDDKFHAIAASVDSREIQQQIVDVMEGGKEAFNRRKEIYDTWKN